MLFTFADLDGRRKAQNALRQSEERFFKSFGSHRHRPPFPGLRISSLPKSMTRSWNYVVAKNRKLSARQQAKSSCGTM